MRYLQSCLVGTNCDSCQSGRHDGSSPITSRLLREAIHAAFSVAAGVTHIFPTARDLTHNDRGGGPSPRMQRTPPRQAPERPETVSVRRELSSSRRFRWSRRRSPACRPCRCQPPTVWRRIPGCRFARRTLRLLTCNARRRSTAVCSTDEVMVTVTVESLAGATSETLTWHVPSWATGGAVCCWRRWQLGGDRRDRGRRCEKCAFAVGVIDADWVEITQAITGATRTPRKGSSTRDSTHARSRRNVPRTRAANVGSQRPTWSTP